MTKKKESKNIAKLAEKAIRKKYESESTKLYTVVGTSIKGKNANNFYAAIDEHGIYIYEFTKEKELIEIDSLEWNDWSQVAIDHIFLKSTYEFLSEGRKREFVINDGKGKEAEEIIRNNTEIKVSVTPRKWYNKILGFRSKKKWKMITASLIYLLIFSAIVGAFSENDNQVNTTDDEPKNEEVAVTDEKNEQEEKQENESLDKKDKEKKEEQQKLDEEKKKAEAKEKAEKEKKYYSEELQADLESYMNRFDDIWEEIWVPTFTGIGNGTVDIYTAYSNLKDLRTKYDILSADIRSIEPDDIMSDKNAEILKEFKSEFTTAINLRNDAAKKAMKMIDKGDFAPSELDKIMDSVSYSDNSVLTAVSKKVELDLNYDLLDEE